MTPTALAELMAALSLDRQLGDQRRADLIRALSRRDITESEVADIERRFTLAQLAGDEDVLVGMIEGRLQ
jgi:hypothetical protein